MIQVDNLSKFFGPVMAVDRISFSVGQGEIVGFLGLNGAGKTTTMRILTSYMPATSGVAPWRVLNLGNSQRVELMRYIQVLEENGIEIDCIAKR